MIRINLSAYRMALKSLALTGLASLVMGCVGENSVSEGASSVSLTTPQRIRSVSAVDPEQLSVALRVNGRNYATTRQDDGRYLAEITVPANGDSEISVVWTELFQNIRLKLAEQSTTVSVGDSPLTITLGDNYTTTGEGFDTDSDGFSNLAERTEGTNPLSADDRPNAASLQLSVALPDSVVKLGDIASVTATANGEPVALQRVSGGVATASLSGLTAGSDINVAVQIEAQGLTVASAEQSATLQLGDDNPVTIEQSAFNFSFDNDSDGISNILELLRGTNPLSPIDYEVIRVLTPPLVDGSLDEAVWRNRFTRQNSQYINRLIMADEGQDQVTTDGLFSAWAAVTDGETLFIAVRIIDEVIVQDSDIVWWRDDSVEIFIDGDNSKQTGNFDLVNDYHIGMRVNDQLLIRGGRSAGLPPSLVVELSAIGFDADIDSGSFPSDLELDGIRDVGFNLEIAISLDEMDIELDEPFGINVHYNDDDVGGARDAKYAWTGEFGIDIDYLEPSSLGTAMLEDADD